ncbi:MAG TPA: ribosome biogenesis GTP-binding protein YihA/YsxC [Thermoanaerobaculia bacterium]|nr:ribosome biogenesis GTP-binding protein YihA/YsxC [Thermoanaerobaculia bacterium]
MKIETAEFVRAAHVTGDTLRDGRPEVAFVGRSNVGKSSLLNRLLGRKGLARISGTPGRTRSINYFLVNGRVYFVDLPGYGYARAGREDRALWAALVDDYLRRPPSDRSNRLVVLLVDGKVGATPLDVQAFAYLAGLGAAIKVVATKIDKVTRGKREAQLREIRRALDPADSIEILPVSAESGDGIRELWSDLDSRL